MTSQLLEKILQTLADVLGEDPAAIRPDSSPSTLKSWDSINHLNLVMALESDFGVAFSPDEVAQMDSVQAIADLVASKRSGQP